MAKAEKTDQKAKKVSSVRHTRAVQRDRTKRPVVGPPDEEVAERLSEIIHPAILEQVTYFHRIGLRERTLTLPIMVALVVSMIWRQISGVCELARLVQTETLLWAEPVQVSQQAISLRLCSLPADLFRRVLLSVLPKLLGRWQVRERPLPPEIDWTQARYTQVVACDGYNYPQKVDHKHSSEKVS